MPRDLTPDLNPKQQRALQMILLGATNQQVSNEGGVAEGTVSGWRRRPNFSAEIRKAMEHQRQVVEANINRLAMKAFRVIDEVLDAMNGEHPDYERRLEGAKIALASAVRMGARYKEVQVEGYT